MSNVKSCLLVGVGGQGAILISKIMSNGFMKAGYDVKQWCCRCTPTDALWSVTFPARECTAARWSSGAMCPTSPFPLR